MAFTVSADRRYNLIQSPKIKAGWTFLTIKIIASTKPTKAPNVEKVGIILVSSYWCFD